MRVRVRIYFDRGADGWRYHLSATGIAGDVEEDGLFSGDAPLFAWALVLRKARRQWPSANVRLDAACPLIRIDMGKGEKIEMGTKRISPNEMKAALQGRAGKAGRPPGHGRWIKLVLVAAAGKVSKVRCGDAREAAKAATMARAAKRRHGLTAVTVAVRGKTVFIGPSEG